MASNLFGSFDVIYCTTPRNVFAYIQWCIKHNLFLSALRKTYNGNHWLKEDIEQKQIEEQAVY